MLGFQLAFEMGCLFFEAAVLLDQVNTALIEPTDETFKRLNILLGLAERYGHLFPPRSPNKSKFAKISMEQGLCQ
jgi:hypothetical protein